MNRPPRPRLRHADPPAGQGAAAPVLDAAALQRLRALDPDGSRGFVAQVMRTYEASLLRYLEALRQARESGALRQAGETAHTLKSSSAAIGALGFAAACAELERRAREGDTAALGAPLSRVIDDAPAVLAAVRAMLPA